jgi:membrane associated rhomboid family serine protease
VTLALVLAWLAVLGSDRSQDRVFEGVFAAAARTGFRDSARDLFVSYCKKQRGEERRCRELSILVWTGYPGRDLKGPPRPEPSKLKTPKPRVPVSKRTRRKALAVKADAAPALVLAQSAAGKLAKQLGSAPPKETGKNGKAKSQSSGKGSVALKGKSPAKGDAPPRPGRFGLAKGKSRPSRWANWTGDLGELKKAAKLRDELSDCGESRRCFLYKDIVWRFLDQQQRSPETLASVPGYAAFLRAQSAFRSEVRRICKTYDCLVPGNVNAASLSWAQLRHSGFLHFLGNAVVFLVFGMYVEQRSKRWLYALGLALGGTVGMAVHALVFSTGDAIIVGGSANVSAALGMFLVFYFRNKMHFHVLLPRRFYLGTGFRADVRYAFPLLFLLGDIGGQIDNGFADLTSSHVAHAAHLAGFAAGALCAWLIARWRPVPFPFLYEDEVKDFVALEATPDLVAATVRAKAILRYNPDNVHAMEAGCARFLHAAAAAPVGGVASPAWELGRQFLAANLTPLVAMNLRAGQTYYVVRLLARLPAWLPFSVYLARLGQVSILRLGDGALHAGEALLALRCYELYLSRFPLSVKVATVEATAALVLENLAPTPLHVEAVRQLLASRPDGLLAPRLGAWLVNTDSLSHAAVSAGRPA